MSEHGLSVVCTIVFIDSLLQQALRSIYIAQVQF